jgi:hypothetical protein
MLGMFGSSECTVTRIVYSEFDTYVRILFIYLTTLSVRHVGGKARRKETTGKTKT